MTRCAVIIGLIVLVLSAITTVQAADVQKGVKRPSQRATTQEIKKERPCDCCQKCLSQESNPGATGTVKKSGCGDCCERCGAMMKEDEMRKAGTISNEEPEIQDKTKQNSCDCCQKCKAAKGTMKSREDKGSDESTGCDDCCAACGQPLKATPEATPPEVIEKKPGDIIEKQKK